LSDNRQVVVVAVAADVFAELPEIATVRIADECTPAEVVRVTLVQDELGKDCAVLVDDLIADQMDGFTRRDCITHLRSNEILVIDERYCDCHYFISL
jgi:hypothetical protein